MEWTLLLCFLIRSENKNKYIAPSSQAVEKSFSKKCQEGHAHLVARNQVHHHLVLSWLTISTGSSQVQSITSWIFVNSPFKFSSNYKPVF